MSLGICRQGRPRPAYLSTQSDQDLHCLLTESLAHIMKTCLYNFVCVEVLRPSQPNGVMSSAVSLPNHTFTGQAWSSKRLTSIVHILSPETDNCPSWISGRERMTVENISWSISTTYIILTPFNPTFIKWNWGLQGYTLLFLFLPKNIDCGYSLELPQRGGSNEFPQSMFRAEIWKIEFLSEIFQILEVKFSLYLNRSVFVMRWYFAIVQDDLNLHVQRHFFV